MADIVLTAITMENPAECDTYEVAFISGHSVGDAVTPDGTVITALANEWGGLIVRAGDATGNKSLILKRGIVRGISGAGAVANAVIFNDGDNTFSDTAPTIATTTFGVKVGKCMSTTRALIDPAEYTKGAA